MLNFLFEGYYVLFLLMGTEGEGEAKAGAEAGEQGGQGEAGGERGSGEAGGEEGSGESEGS